MTWPTADVPTTNLDAGTDSPATARADLLDMAQKLNQVRNHVTAFAQGLLDDADAAAARTTLGTDIYKGVPANTVPTNGEMAVVTAGLTLNSGAAAGTVYSIYNNSAANISILYGAGVTLRLAGTSSTANRTLSPRGLASVWCLSTTEYIISGAGLL